MKTAKEKKDKAQKIGNDNIRLAIIRFFEESGITKTEFAERYGCRKEYLSRVLSPDCKENVLIFGLAYTLQSFGYLLEINFQKNSVTIKKNEK